MGESPHIPSSFVAGQLMLLVVELPDIETLLRIIPAPRTLREGMLFIQAHGPKLRRERSLDL